MSHKVIGSIEGASPSPDAARGQSHADGKLELYRSIAKRGTECVVDGDADVVYFAGRGPLDIATSVVSVSLPAVAQLAAVLIQTAYPDRSAIAQAMQQQADAQADGDRAQ